MQARFFNDDGWKVGLPWLYYDQTPQEAIRDADPVDMVVSFTKFGDDEKRTDTLTFFLARYTVEGEFMGIQKMKTQLSLCPMTYVDVQRMKMFGVVTVNECEFELKNLISNDPAKLPKDANSFFELYLQDANGNLVDVPVLITNFRDDEGKNPN